MVHEEQSVEVGSVAELKLGCQTRSHRLGIGSPMAVLSSTTWIAEAGGVLKVLHLLHTHNEPSSSPVPSRWSESFPGFLNIHGLILQFRNLLFLAAGACLVVICAGGDSSW